MTTGVRSFPHARRSVRDGEDGKGDDLLAAVCRMPALGGDRGQRVQAREEHLRVAAGRDRAECADELCLNKPNKPKLVWFGWSHGALWLPLAVSTLNAGLLGYGVLSCFDGPCGWPHSPCVVFLRSMWDHCWQRAPGDGISGAGVRFGTPFRGVGVWVALVGLWMHALCVDAPVQLAVVCLAAGGGSWSLGCQGYAVEYAYATPRFRIAGCSNYFVRRRWSVG
jgi:hypothetical protein